MNYYNDNDPKACAWLRELIAQNLIAPGIVDCRSITDIQPDELRAYTQVHLFAGIGGWSYALRLAGWPDDEPVWTGSCPCQPFSVAGKRKGKKDPRHLWPQMRRLVAGCKPPVLFGEQVASKAGRLWLSGVRADLEALAYEIGAADLCAAGISAPMVSQRLHWVAEAAGKQMGNGGQSRFRSGESHSERLGAPNSNGCEARNETAETARHGYPTEPAGGDHSRLDAPNRYHQHWWSGPLQVGWNCIEGQVERSGRKYRAQWRVKPGLSLLAHGIPGRVAQLCGFGNAILPQLAAEFIAAYLDIRALSRVSP